MQPIVIFGAGGFGREVLGIVRDINAAVPTWDVLGFVDDEAAVGEIRDGLPVLGGRDWLAENRVHLALAVGSPAAKRSVSDAVRPQVMGFPALVHPTAVVNEFASIAEGAIVAAQCIVSSCTRIGRFALLNVVAAVGHDADVGDFATLSPRVGVMGNAVIGEGAYVGAGATVLPGVRIGECSVVGAGAVANRDVPAHCTAVGVPARPLPVRAPLAAMQ